jgi:hypothetical protein
MGTMKRLKYMYHKNGILKTLQWGNKDIGGNKEELAVRKIKILKWE